MESANKLRPWGIALERLRMDRGLTSSELCYRVRMGQPQYLKIIAQSKNGPTFGTLKQLLSALNCTWTEWGERCDAVEEANLATNTQIET